MPHVYTFLFKVIGHSELVFIELEGLPCVLSFYIHVIIKILQPLLVVYVKRSEIYQPPLSRH